MVGGFPNTARGTNFGAMVGGFPHENFNRVLNPQ